MKNESACASRVVVQFYAAVECVPQVCMYLLYWGLQGCRNCRDLLQADVADTLRKSRPTFQTWITRDSNFLFESCHSPLRQRKGVQFL